jgi:hypothetical protein
MLSTNCGYRVDSLSEGTVKSCPQEVDIVETPFYFLIIYYPHSLFRIFIN